MPLLKILQNSPRNKRSSIVAKPQVAPKYVNEQDLKPIGIVKPLERPMLAVDVKPNVIITDKTAKDYRLIVTAMLTKFPHYEFVCKVKSGELGRIKYWFKDTHANVTRVFGYKDMEDLLINTLTRTVNPKEQGIEEKDEIDIPRYCLFDDVPISYRNLLKIRYRLYKLAKYGTLEPFFTRFISLKDKKIVETKEYDKPTVIEQVEEKIEQPKILGSNGTGLQIVNGFIVSIKNV